MHAYQDEDGLFGILQELRNSPHVVMTVNMPVERDCKGAIGRRRYDDLPFHKVLGPLSRERVETVSRHDLSTNHVGALLLGIIMAT